MNLHLEVFTKLSSVYSHLNKKLDRYLGAMHGLGVSEFRVLSELNSVPNATMSRIELAERLSLTASGVTRLVNPMEKIGLVEKMANDRDARVSLVVLGDTGRTRLQEAVEGVNHVMRSSLEQLSSDEMNVLKSILSKLPS
ncbi:MarR family transcriptional regulator [Arenicella sp. 4NH20-0111]|uniref:MarR family winged helix-turn-helix transcriptional regulator n=1 Tax=Arenicella sp. 4NH20-0111 TaxID=3127648 RepID=UPI00310BCAD5